MIKTYNKLVRDNIPEIIKSNNGIPKIRTLDDLEYKKELEIKLIEECNEVISTSNSEERTEELADVLEVIRSLAVLESKSLEDIIKLTDSKKTKRGGFFQRIYLEEVEED